MNNEEEQRFFNQIEEVLHTHEDSYELGAWEEFDANRKKNKKAFPIFGWVAAAVVLVFASFGLFQIAKQDHIQDIPSVVKNIDKKDKIENVLPSPKENATAEPLIAQKLAVQSAEKARKLIARAQFRTVATVESIPTPDNNVVIARKNDQESGNVIASNVVIAVDQPIVKNPSNFGAEPVKPTMVYAGGAYDSLVNRNQVIAATNKNTNKLTYSLVVSPSVSNYKMNFGGGMGISYALGSRLSISSGLMYTAINGKSDEKGSNAMSFDRSQAQETFLAVSGIEVPLGIQYQTNGGFYASAGVSAVGLINDKLEYSYFQDRTVSNMDVVGGVTKEVIAVVSEKKIQKSIEPLSNYMGFFNFSAGKKQSIGNLKLNIGPFVKVPFSSVSTEKIKLLQGGLKISVDF